MEIPAILTYFFGMAISAFGIFIYKYLRSLSNREGNKMYYNTTKLRGRELWRSYEKAISQEQRIQNFFEKFPELKLTPDQINYAVFHDQVPITSVRRAITDLTTLGILEKTDHKREGKYGALTHCWRLRRDKKEPFSTMVREG
jgi:hypothetical protein